MKKNEHSKELLFVTHKYPPSVGGMQKQSYELIQNIKEVRKIHTIIYKGNYPKIIFLLFATPWIWLKIMRNKNIGLVHANDGLMALFITPILLVKRVLLCATIHGLDVVFNLRAYQWWVKKFLSRFSFLLAVSEATRQECIKAGIDPDSVFFVANAVELPEQKELDPSFKSWLFDQYQIDIEDKIVISSVGRPVPRKGFYWFSKNIIPKIPGALYFIVGPDLKSSWVVSAGQRILPSGLFEMICKMTGVQLDHLLLSQLNSKNVILLGSLTEHQLHQLYLHTHLFAMPNRHVTGDFEGFGLVALEAGSMGAVCLAANVDGIPSAIENEKNGFLLPSMDEQAWVEKIKELSDDEELNRWRNHFLNYFKEFQHSWKDMSDEYLVIFDSKLAGHDASS